MTNIVIAQERVNGFERSLPKPYKEQWGKIETIFGEIEGLRSMERFESWCNQPNKSSAGDDPQNYRYTANRSDITVKQQYKQYYQ